jgi:low temperature requirement protein LtrA
LIRNLSRSIALVYAANVRKECNISRRKDAKKVQGIKFIAVLLLFCVKDFTFSIRICYTVVPCAIVESNYYLKRILFFIILLT